MCCTPRDNPVRNGAIGLLYQRYGFNRENIAKNVSFVPE
jgi:hypothetical protein